MSRSRRKAFKAVCGSSAGIKWYKRWHSKRERAKLRNEMAHDNHDVAYQLIPWDEWDCPRDGYRMTEDPKFRRK